VDVEDIAQLDEPDEEKIKKMIDSIYDGRSKAAKQFKDDADMFYAVTLSGAAARIAIRDWIETGVENLRLNIALWFHDIEIGEYNSDKKKLLYKYLRFWELVRATKSKSGKEVEYGRVGAALWKSAVLGTAPPLWILSATLNRIRAEQGNVTSARIALLKICLNKKTTIKGGLTYMATLDPSNKNIAYTCGRLFAVLESIQYHASGGNLNASIRERFFSSASTTPSTAFGRLMKLSQHHLSKIRGEKPGLAVNLDKQLQELMCNVEGSQFPVTFSLEEQASFAIGYYHQRQHDFAK
jgi:CRISPR-associated protein Csd1